MRRNPLSTAREISWEQRINGSCQAGFGAFPTDFSVLDSVVELRFWVHRPRLRPPASFLCPQPINFRKIKAVPIGTLITVQPLSENKLVTDVCLQQRQ